jgi:hypothetical protein
VNAQTPPPLTADAVELDRFVDATFRYASEGTRIALRGFYDDRDDRPFAIEDVTINGAGLATVKAAAAAMATRAAQ